ncbi:Uncharacterized conserved protein YecE, DUF72 family [Thermanaeromonas toyohensis ToBE]|uniref:Uncharacterized conserved protein YecE, DUF72 family n=1 Tax=Thermanaeromonas toyohensis ToBE TaxID=698762 RepID=A0A1W1VEV2_9FIRM|nr:DUF72 domain-containing protein [Thermanaeromonas toyohensis]SMB91753.1 Uncharacterized conserved protein YecE, DUF72 family [Thermanaeromonas toyohensis ToBE]
MKTLGELNAKIYIGTSGYSYRDWIGSFYPPGIQQEDMLSYYAREFPFTEINFSYYRLPSPKVFESMLHKVPESFLFTVKAFQSLTHERGDTVKQDAIKFREALKPLRQQNRLGALLLQFPYSFPYNDSNRSYLAFLRELLGDLPLVVEFRHNSWLKEATWNFLKSLSIGYVCVDGPRLAGLVANIVKVTAPVAYVRFHGRNANKWWKHEKPYERYDYLYSEKELAEWVPRISLLSRHSSRIFVAFNNHFGAQAVYNARMLKKLLAL